MQWYKVPTPAPYIGPNLFSSNVWETGDYQEYPVPADVPGEIDVTRTWSSCIPPADAPVQGAENPVSSWWRDGVPEEYWLKGGPISFCGGVGKIPEVAGVEVGGLVTMHIDIPMTGGIEVGGEVEVSEGLS